jgi:site-specific DNA-methyltransferase (adenine-specific)
MTGDAIRSLRRSLQLTQASLGLRIGVHGCSVGRWERGVHKPRPAHADRLAGVAGDAGACKPKPAPRINAGASKRKRAPRINAGAVEVAKAPSGDGWVLHRGDCFDVLPAIDDGAVDAVIADPPYCSGGLHVGTRQQTTQRKYQQNGVQVRRQDFDGDQRDQLSFIAWLTDLLRRCHRVVRRGGLVVVFSDFRQLTATQTAMQAGGFLYRGCAVWDKTEGARPQRSKLRNQAEFALWGSKGDLPVAGNIPTQAGVFRWAVRPADKFHITGKPTEVMRWLVRQVPPGGRILDPVAGSGTTGVAALLEGRSFVGIEQDPYYAQIAALRLSAAQRGQRLDARRLALPAQDMIGRA